MTRISQSIAQEVDCFKKDLADTKGEALNLKNTEHKRIISNIVANEKAYCKHIDSRCLCFAKSLNECDCEV